MMSNLRARILTALLLLPLVLGAMWLGGAWFLVLLGVIGVALIWEWVKILDDKIASPLSAIYVMVLLGILFHFWHSSFITLQVFAIVGIGALGALIIAALHGKNKFLSAAGVLYLLTPFILLADLRGEGHTGAMALLVFLCLVWASDSGAYFTGSAIGGAKLAVSISQHKTWSGAAGGIMGAVLVAAVVVYQFGATPKLFLWAVVISVATQVGDLIESFVKRRHNIKDSSNLLPGHGGILDRVDGLLFAITFLYALFFFLGLGEHSAADLLLKST